MSNNEYDTIIDKIMNNDKLYITDSDFDIIKFNYYVDNQQYPNNDKIKIKNIILDTIIEHNSSSINIDKLNNYNRKICCNCSLI